jgi:hypothetical protein
MKANNIEIKFDDLAQKNHQALEELDDQLDNLRHYLADNDRS